MICLAGEVNRQSCGAMGSERDGRGDGGVAGLREGEAGSRWEGSMIDVVIIKSAARCRVNSGRVECEGHSGREMGGECGVEGQGWGVGKTKDWVDKWLTKRVLGRN